MNQQFLDEANLKLITTEATGDSLFTTQQLLTKQIIFEDVPLISYLLPARNFVAQTHCANCFKKNVSSSCPTCDLFYCSEGCQQAHYLAHWALCQGRNSKQIPRIATMHSKTEIMSNYSICEVISQILAKIVIFQLKGNDLEAAIQLALGPYKKILNTQNLTCNFDVKKAFKTAKLFFLQSVKLLDFAEDLTGLVNEMLTFEFFKFLVSIIALNNSSVIIGDELVGIAVYNVASKLNHSCDPNVFFSWGENRVVEIVAERDICQNEELVVSYIQECKTVQERQRELLEGWGFVCQCKKCISQVSEKQ
ncbi:SET domain-containing protein [Spironucleus salmonicida]|uniref:SET domain-containing protein n=1 Tax=Spironucleus salmonicida TaxID=348837 RepID=V6LZX7_9EUKA|nr:SET domain-containing protein [Spironucleus salmonicida]|eukprot:EST49316.1 SET domain-containing protein [Spironucleus salmonicida]